MKISSYCLPLILAASFVAVDSVRAQGALAPTNAPAPTMRSLDQIYNEVSKLAPANPLVMTTALASNQLCTIHMSAEGQVQGEIRGESTIKGLERTIGLIGFAHEIISPRDAASGLPTGKRQHKPLKIIKYIDRTTPQFYAVLVNNENLRSVVLKFYQTDASGKPVNYFKITLTNANVSHIANAFPDMETIEFTYQKIEWLHVPTGTESMDDWEAPIQ